MKISLEDGKFRSSGTLIKGWENLKFFLFR